jgi:hypothetical protein
MDAFSGLRSFFMSIFIAGVLPMIEAYGVAVTDIASALLGWLGFLCVFRFLRANRPSVHILTTF